MSASSDKVGSSAEKALPRLLSQGLEEARSAHLQATPPANEATLKHVAICGVSYCGSTLMARVLGSLAGAANIGESHWLLSRREGGVTVPADPATEEWAAQVHCAGCGEDCAYLTREFRIGLHADRVHWYHRIADRLQTRILISADKNFDKLVALDPLLRLDALILFKSPFDAVYSHFRYRGIKGHPDPSAREVAQYLDKWARSYDALMDRLDVRGRKVCLGWRQFCADPAPHLERACRVLDLPYDGGVLERIDPVQHCLGGNGQVNKGFRRSASFQIQPRPRHTLPVEQFGAVEVHDRSREVHARLLDLHGGVFGLSESLHRG